MSELGKVKLNVSQTGSGAKPPAAGQFFVVFLCWKKTYFSAIGLHFAHVQRFLKELDFEHLKAN